MKTIQIGVEASEELLDNLQSPPKVSLRSLKDQSV